MSTPLSERDVYTVSRLNAEARSALERALRGVWVEGELSNVKRHSSGHWYFTLKDAAAQVPCAMWRMHNLRAAVIPRDGMRVLVYAKPTVYEVQGKFQLSVERMEDAGEGALRRRFEALKAALAAEGLFDNEAKRPLPRLPRRIGVVTSPTGAALRDILHILGRRFPSVPVLVYPVPVQGAGAAKDIAAMLDLASARGEVDVLILARGGGSLEDLWAFNEEAVARAIRACRIPVIAGIGHETDVTIADFAADLRAPTPSGAAEQAVPDQSEWRRTLGLAAARLMGLGQRAIDDRLRRLDVLIHRLRQAHPRHRLEVRGQRLDELASRLEGGMERVLTIRRERLEWLRQRFERAEPRRRIEHHRQTLDHSTQRLIRGIEAQRQAQRARLTMAARTLQAVSPLATLGRGYSILTDAHGRVVRSAKDVTLGDRLEARTADGHLTATVTSVTD
jgi:exodeoxyribonuclease VII large subunit